MNLTKINNQIEVANNWEKYCSKISLPKKLENEISSFYFILIINYEF